MDPARGCHSNVTVNDDRVLGEMVDARREEMDKLQAEQEL